MKKQRAEAYHHHLCLCVVLQWFTQPSQKTNTRSLNKEIWSLNTDENTQIRLEYKYKYTKTDKKYTNTNTNTFCMFVFLFSIVFPSTPSFSSCCWPLERESNFFQMFGSALYTNTNTNRNTNSNTNTNINTSTNTNTNTNTNKNTNTNI